MSFESDFSRRKFLKITATAGASAMALRGVGLGEPRHDAADVNAADSQQPNPVQEPSRTLRGSWPQDYTVQKDERRGLLVLSTPYYSIHHDLKRGGAIADIHYTHGNVANLLVSPFASSIAMVRRERPAIQGHPSRSQEILDDLNDASPSVSVSHSGPTPVVTVESRLLGPDDLDAGVKTRTVYQYRWGHIKIHKEFIFPQEPLQTATLTTLSTVLDRSLTHYGHRPGEFDDAVRDPFGIQKMQWGETQAGSGFHASFSTRYVPCHIVLANPGIEGIEWFVSDDLAQWYYQMTREPGTGSVSLDPRTHPLGVALTVSPLALPSNVGRSSKPARSGFVALAGTYTFDYYIGVPILEGHAHKRWLDRSFTANHGNWVSDDQIRRNAEAGVINMTLHNDGGNGPNDLFWHDGTYPPFPPDEMKKMEHVVAAIHQNGMTTQPYFSNHELNPSTETFKVHGEEWGRKPDDQGNLSPENEFGFLMCLKSGWTDFFKGYVDTVLKHGHWDGTYYDWNTGLYCNNPLHMGQSSNGVSGEKRLGAYAFSPTGHWDIDELLEMMEWTRRRVGPDKLMIVHTTGTPMLAAENYADYVITMEWGYGKLLDGMPKPDQLPLEWNFAGARPRAVTEYGTIDPKATPQVRRLFYLTALMTGTTPWPASDETLQLFKILRPLGDIERYNFQDWRNRAVRLDHDDCISAVYSRPGHAYILLANLTPSAKTVSCTIDSTALKYPMASVRTAKLVPGGKSSNLKTGRLIGAGEKISLPGEGVVLLHLQG